MSQARILIVDDEAQVRCVLAEAVQSQPWRVETAGDGQEALDRLCAAPFDVAVLDLMMPRLDGLGTLEAIRQRGIRTDVVVLTGYGSVERAVRAMKLGARDFLLKPVNLSGLIATIRRLLEERLPTPHCLADRLDRFLKERADRPALHLTDLCAHFRISPRYASRLFHDHIGASFLERLAHHRAERARGLIASTDAPLYLIAEQCGFANARRFSEAFHRMEGMPPRKYREICADERKKCR
jgi:YesN/AraC family two-component response regulator